MHWHEETYRPSRTPLKRSGEVNERVAYMEATLEAMSETLSSLRNRIAHGEHFNETTLEYRLRLEHQISNMSYHLQAISQQVKDLEAHKETQADQTEQYLTWAKWGAAAALAGATLLGKIQAETVEKLVSVFLK